MTNTELDMKRLSEFGKTNRWNIKRAAAALMISVGHKVALFDTMSDIGSASVEKISNVAGLNERYVREWLSAMTTAQIVQYDSNRDLYTLPNGTRSDAYSLCWAEKSITLYAIHSPACKVEDQIVHHFKHGGGVPYSEYTTFHAVMAEASAARFDALLIDTVLPIVHRIT